jgi:signal peptidase II
MKKMTSRIFLVLLVLLLTVGVDQVTKKLAQAWLNDGQTRSLVGDVFVLHYLENTGAFLGMGAGLPAPVRILVFVAFPVIMLAGLLVFMFGRKEVGAWFLLGLSLITGGGIGNLVDRILYDGRVTDFMNMGIGSLRTGVFNFADFFVLAGLGIILAAEFSKKPDRPPDREPKRGT